MITLPKDPIHENSMECSAILISRSKILRYASDNVDHALNNQILDMIMTHNQVVKKEKSKPNIICICIREPRFCLCTKKEIPVKHNVFEMEMRLPIEIKNKKN